MVYYATFPIREQAEKGNWNYSLKAVFCIGILDFIFNDYENIEEHGQVIHEIKLRNAKGRTFYDKLTYIYLEMPNFKKTEAELETRLDKWLYFIKNLEDFQSIPHIFKDEVVFLEAFEKAELAKFDQVEMAAYEANLKTYRDIYAVLETAIETAKSEGRIMGEMIGEIKGVAKVAKAMKDNGAAIDFISKTTGLSAAEIELL